MSPYENRLRIDGFHRVALLAFVRPEKEPALAEAIDGHPPDLAETLKAAGIRNLNIFTRALANRTFAFAYFEITASDVEQAQGILCDASPWFASLAEFLEPHPRVPGGNHPWLRTELINIVADAPIPAGATVQKFGLMSQLRPEKELTYRTLHQTNWPGVVDTMARTNFRNWTTFLFELGEDLFLFTYHAYIGTDIEADSALMAADPVTQRWWKHTDPCLVELDPGKGFWTSTTALLTLA